MPALSLRKEMANHAVYSFDETAIVALFNYFKEFNCTFISSQSCSTIVSEELYFIPFGGTLRGEPMMRKMDVQKGGEE